MFNAKFKNSYNKADVNGNMRTTYVYSLSGSEKAIAAYTKQQGEYFKVDENATDVLGDANPHYKKPLYFSQVPLGKECTLELTTTGRMVLSADEAMEATMNVQQEVAVRLALEARKSVNSKLQAAKTVVLNQEHLEDAPLP